MRQAGALALIALSACGARSELSDWPGYGTFGGSPDGSTAADARAPVDGRIGVSDAARDVMSGRDGSLSRDGGAKDAPSSFDVTPPADAPPGDATGRRDAPTTRDAGSPDRAPDAPHVAIKAPRPIAPLSTATVTSQTPTLRWELAPDDDGALVDLCLERSCASPLFTVQVTATSLTVPERLSAGVYYWRLRGSAGGVVGDAVSAVWELFVGHGSAPVDTSWGTVFDVNGDGFADALVGAPDLSVNGAVFLYMGTASGLSMTPISLDNPSGSGEGFAGSLANVGDVNGDGFPDVVVGAPLTNMNEGSVYLYFGSKEGLSHSPQVMTAPSPAPYGYFGVSAASAGDVNGDGYADVVIGAPGGNGVEVAYVFLGGPNGLGPSTTLMDPHGMTNPFGGRFGGAVAGACDVNGDGYADVIVGASEDEPDGAIDQGNAYVFLGGEGGIGTTPTLLTSPAVANDVFGVSVACANDLNGDGYADVVIGAPTDGEYGTTAAAYVYFGSAGGISTTPTALASGRGEGDSFGAAVASPGDIDGDGFADLIIGAPTTSSMTEDDVGAAYAFFGNAQGVSTSGVYVSTASGTEARFGAPIAATGDVNADGYADVLIGAPGVGGSAGAAYLFYGGNLGIGTLTEPLVAPDAGGFGSAIASSLRGE